MKPPLLKGADRGREKEKEKEKERERERESFAHLFHNKSCLQSAS